MKIRRPTQVLISGTARGLGTAVARAADPAEIAAVCAFRTSSDASMVTGHTVVADGGGAVVDSSTEIFDATNA